MTDAAGWDGSGYDRLADAQWISGVAILPRLQVPRGATVVDAGCGSGRVTENLLRVRKDVQVIALDVSESMTAAAQRRLAPFGSRVEVRRADLSEPWPLAEPVDGILSTHAFHWILDHPALFAAAREALGAGGQLVAICGGRNSLRRILDLAADMGVEVRGRNHYADPEATADILRSAGYTDVWTWTEHDDVRFPDRAALARYLADAALAPYERGAEMASAVASRMQEPVAEFVRLHVLARRR